MNAVNLLNELGRSCQRQEHLSGARVFYVAATVLAAGWAVPWFNPGLIAKFERRWPHYRSFNQRSPGAQV